MKSKEMFKKLGYEQVSLEDIHGNELKYMYQYEKFDGNFHNIISFNDSTKLMHTHCELFNNTIDFVCFSIELLNAIHKCMEELGWLDEQY